MTSWDSLPSVVGSCHCTLSFTKDYSQYEKQEEIYAFALNVVNVVPIGEVFRKCWWLPISGVARMVWAKSWICSNIRCRRSVTIITKRAIMSLNRRSIIWNKIKPASSITIHPRSCSQWRTSVCQLESQIAFWARLLSFLDTWGYIQSFVEDVRLQLWKYIFETHSTWDVAVAEYQTQYLESTGPTPRLYVPDN